MSDEKGWLEQTADDVIAAVSEAGETVVQGAQDFAQGCAAGLFVIAMAVFLGHRMFR